MTQPTTRIVLLPAQREGPSASTDMVEAKTDTTVRYAQVPLTADEGRLLDALAASPDGLRGSEAATVLGANRLYAGRVAKALVRLRLATKRAGRYHLRKETR